MKKYLGPKDRLDAARRPFTPPEELAVLSSSEYVFVQEAVAANPNTPPQVLDTLIPHTLANENDFKIAASLLLNPALTPETCIKLINRIIPVAATISPRDYYSTMMIERLCAHKAVPHAPLCQLLGSQSFPKHLRRRVASEETRTDILLFLQKDNSETVRKKSAKALQNKETKRTEQSGVDRGAASRSPNGVNSSSHDQMKYLYEFTSEWRSGVRSERVVCQGPRSFVEKFIALTEFAGLFGGYVLSVDHSGTEFVGVWSRRMCQRFRRILRERGAHFDLKTDAPKLNLKIVAVKSR